MGSTLEAFHSSVRPVLKRQSPASAIKLEPLTSDNVRKVEKSARKMFPGDAEPVRRSINAALRPREQWPGAFQETTRWIERYVAYADNTRVGMTGLAKLADDENDAVWLEWIGVRPKHQGTGKGPQLLEATLALASKKGFATLRLWTTADHTAAIKMYDQAGFRHQETPYVWNDGYAVQIHSIALGQEQVKPYRGKGGDVGFALYGVRKYVHLHLAS